jgi:hypothetical protein
MDEFDEKKFLFPADPDQKDIRSAVKGVVCAVDIL